MNVAMKAMPDKLVTTHLEIPDQAHFRPAFLDEANHADCQVIELEEVDVDFYRFLYGAVGGAWSWTDRLRESARDEIQRDLERPELTVDVSYVRGAPAGFMEMVRESRDFEIIYFGLREAFIGRGLGKHFLSVGVQRAWDNGAQRVWLHTCNMDGPHAMSNYLKRGFQVFQVDEDPLPPWLRPDGAQDSSIRPDSEDVPQSWRHLRQ